MMHRDTPRPVTVKLSLDIRERVKRLAAARHRTSHWILREAIQQYVAREERRGSLHQDAVQVPEADPVAGHRVTPTEGDGALPQPEPDEDIGAPPWPR